MVEIIRRKLAESPAARWTMLFLVSFTMLAGYIVSDVMSPLKTMLDQQLGWNSTDYGTFTSGYGIFNIFLFMLIIGGMILDRKGPRFTGMLAIAIMLAGVAMKYWALSADFGGKTISLEIFGWDIFTFKRQVFYALLGFASAGVGIEMIGVTANKVVVKWFQGRSLALALGLNVAAGRIGTAIALFGAYPYAKWAGTVSAPLALCLFILCAGLMAFLVYCMMDRKYERHEAPKQQQEEEAAGRLSDIWSIARIRGFWYITILCLLFYSAVLPFLKFATELMIQKFHVGTNFAGAIPALLPLGNILLTPLFGFIYDRKGRGVTIMIIGSVLLTLVHFIFAIPAFTAAWLAVMLMILLGAAFSLVPSAMWPSVPKIIPYNRLGTAYSMIFWIQNWGLAFVPVLIGWILNRYCITGEIMVDGVMTTSYDYTVPMMIFAVFGLCSLLFALLLRREDARKGYGLEQHNMIQ